MVEKFKSFITEEEKPYKLVVLTHSAAGIRDTKDEPTQSGTEILRSKASGLGIKVFVGDFVGAYTKKSGNKRFIYSFPFDEEDKELSISLQIGARFNDQDTDISEQNDLIQLKNINDEKNIEETFHCDEMRI